MTVIHLIEENEASPETRQIYDEMKAHFNIPFVPNVFKAMAHQGTDMLRMQWDGFRKAEEYWGKEKLYLLSLAIDVINNCSYCINFDAAMLKQIGYDDEKIETLINFIGMSDYFNKYVEGLQLETDVTPEMMEKRMAA